MDQRGTGVQAQPARPEAAADCCSMATEASVFNLNIH